MSRILRFALAMSFIVASASLAHAESLLAEFQFTGQLRNPEADVPFRPFISYGDPAFPPATGFIQTDAMTLVDILMGNRHDLVGDFTAFAALATNGVDQTIHVGFEIDGIGSTWNSQTETTLLAGAFNLAPGVGSPDFAGYEVTRVAVLGTSYAPLQGGLLELSFQYSVYGVPEPGTWALLGMGAIALVGQAYRQKQGRRRRS